MNIPMVDVAVLGAGVSGVCAAVQAARQGLKVALIEKNGLPGGSATMAGISCPGIFHAWGKQVISGIGWQLVEACRRLENRPLPDLTRENEGHWYYQIEVSPVLFAALMDQALNDAAVELHYHTMPAALHAEDDDWRITFCTKDGLSELRARIVVDCTGDANAAHLAGYELRTPEECQPGTLSVYADGYDPNTLDFDAIEAAFDDAVARGELSSEDTGWSGAFNRHFLYCHGNNSNHICNINAFDSAGRTRIEIAGRESILRVYRFLKRQPGLEHLAFHLGGCECGVRETRTIVGVATVTVEDYITGRAWEDALCHAFYPVDLHDKAGKLDYRKLEHGVVPEVPRGALIPRNSHRFLAAGRILSSDRLANSALRVQAVCMATGQAAGAVAAVAVRNQCEPLAADLAEVRRILVENGAIVPRFKLG